LIQVSLGVELAGQFGDCVGAQRVRRIVFDVRMPGASVEDVIGGKMNQARVDLAAGDGQVADREAVHQEGGLRLFFGNIHLVVSRCVEYHVGSGARQGAFHRRGIGNIHLAAPPTGDGVAPVPQFAD